MQSALLKDFYLIQGEWQEERTYDSCGQRISRVVDFQADGMGGAYFQARMK